ncbi:BgTH12-07497 [Blumeria graminis f. sp. triticale]|uniref:BgTH12-07497 n=1 Tax=Blumeria graminis f. sp. triticale TaxID=1689686 RepID=A0A9W4GC92_BLUGR|nr:BgTH12-07497 [Blumeria graminis f. sp. triticale]
MPKLATEDCARSFFEAKYFAVVGASNDTAKFGHQVLHWYVRHSFAVTPINPTKRRILVPSPSSAHQMQALDTLANLSAIPNPEQTSVSIVTPPNVTHKVLQDASHLGFHGVWLQPGTYDDEIIEYALENFGIVVAGDGGIHDQGWCVLVDGEQFV